MVQIILRTRFKPSWFRKGYAHHITLPRVQVQSWMLENHLTDERGRSCKIEIYANGENLQQGTLNYDTGYLTGVVSLFRAFSIHSLSKGVSLYALLSCDLDRPEIHFSRERPEAKHAEIRWEQAPLHPFSAKAEDPYIAVLEASVQEREKSHEQLLNSFYRFLRRRGYSPGYSKAIDLAVEYPPLIVEAKAIKDDSCWTANIRAAVAQLHEYRWFYLADAKLLFLASRPVPESWQQYLRDCHGIKSAWPDGESFYVDGIDEILPKPCQRDAKSNQAEDT